MLTMVEKPSPAPDGNIRCGVELPEAALITCPPASTREGVMLQFVRMGVLDTTAVTFAAEASTAQAVWASKRPVEITMPAESGEGANRMARVTQYIVTKHKLMKRSLVVANKAGDDGGNEQQRHQTLMKEVEFLVTNWES
jgi:hypothetical protein